MIFGVGCDIVDTERFRPLTGDEKFLARYFNSKEFPDCQLKEQQLCEHFASRFAAKEAFSKALGTGFAGFHLVDVYVAKEASGKPYICLENEALEIKNRLCGVDAKVFLSISHEKKNVMAVVIIDRG